MYKILICDPLSESAICVLKDAPDVIFSQAPSYGEKELSKIIPEYNAVIVRSATQISKAIINSAENLKVIGRAGSGLDNIDTEYASKKGIKVLNTPGTNAPAVAELAIGFLFSLARSIPLADHSMKAGKWLKKEFVGIELQGKTLGLIGCGTIGKLVARKASALGMEVLIYNRSEVDLNGTGASQVDLHKLYSKSDFISVHLPLSSETKGIVAREQFNMMKDKVRIVNTARGGIIDEESLLEALDSGKVAAAALDVYQDEPNYNKTLAGRSDVIATPHIGASSFESQERVGVLIVDQVLEYLRSKYMFF